MPRSLRKFKEANARLSKELCSIPGCTRNRLGVNQYCNAHSIKSIRYGHPQGHTIPRAEYQKELNEVLEMFQGHKDHPGLVSVLRWIDDWIEVASNGEAPAGNYIFGRIHVKRIQGRDISALDILAEVAAVWVYAQRFPQSLPDDNRLTYALARNVARLATFEKAKYGITKTKSTKYPTALELRGVGERIRQTLALFLINVVKSLEAKAEKAKDFRTSLSIPFE
ncbi:hypothetical protein [Dechloromonas denitrificans]|uniref:hypothetical protein n=1 Tax=Dechloromonas denitrificans TaxID=281362 RepID=UPI001CF8EDAF|nr:hypothetical protein [Dechloromonas denitrificans]UCV01870.1 hypothetical protein KI611_12165 [Dechloromonas denitrificans]